MPEDGGHRARMQAAADACLQNAHRLINETYQLEFEEPLSSKLLLSMIAQEELAKAFLFILVRDGVIPWTRYLWRATNDHACKHLVGVLMDYIAPEDIYDVEKMEEWIRCEVELGDRVPERVASAIDILRHEKIGRWMSRNWDWVDPPEYDREVIKIAEGERDRVKQDALYVRVSPDGTVLSTPDAVLKTLVDEEFDRVGRFLRLVISMMEGSHARREYEKLSKFLSAVFGTAGAR